MKKIISFFLMMIFSFHSFSAATHPAYNYLRTEAKKTEGQTTQDSYQNIMSGTLAFIVGNIGYFTTKSQTLQLAYSGVQTVGILSVGQGVYDYYRPNSDQSFLSLLRVKEIHREVLAEGFIKILAAEERAKRLSLLYGAGLLGLQYFTNAITGDTPKDLKDIYLFLGGVNVIVVTYAYFGREKYEKYTEENNISLSYGPLIRPQGGGAFVSLTY